MATALVAGLQAVESRAAEEAPATEGDPNIGRNLFTGAQSFENGAPSCRACHSIAGIGGLGGGSLGPDLTGTFDVLGEDMVLTWPETVVPMAPIFGQQPLTDQEKAHLLAFFGSDPVAPRAVERIWELTGLAVGGALVLFALAGLIWRHRSRGVRQPMVETERRT